jgi:hypothetical protein
VASTGQFFTVTFVKKDGTIRKMNARSLTPKELKVVKGAKDDTTYLTVYDRQKKAFRNINMDTIREISAGGLKIYASGAAPVVKESKPEVQKNGWIKNTGVMPEAVKNGAKIRVKWEDDGSECDKVIANADSWYWHLGTAGSIGYYKIVG